MNSQAITVRRASINDAQSLQVILNEVIEQGNAFLDEEPKSIEATIQGWLSTEVETFVACDAASGDILGAYLLKPNASGRGAHIANASYMVKRSARGRGVGHRLGAHSLEQARSSGFGAMQFNFVVSVNTSAVTLWQALGFKRIGTVPNGFRLRDGQYVDTYIMYRSLNDEIA